MLNHIFYLVSASTTDLESAEPTVATTFEAYEASGLSLGRSAIFGEAEADFTQMVPVPTEKMLRFEIDEEDRKYDLAALEND